MLEELRRLAMPVLRVVVMVAVFRRDRDCRLAIVAAIVLITIVAGIAVGIHMSNPRARAH